MAVSVLVIGQLQYAIKLFFWVLLFLVFLQILLKVVLSKLLPILPVPVTKASFGLIFGSSIRNVHFSTKGADVKIGRVRLRFSPEISMVLHDVDVVLKKVAAERNRNSDGQQPEATDATTVLKNSLEIHMQPWLLRIVSWLLPLTIYLRRTRVHFPVKSTTFVDLVSLSINEITSHHAGLSVFAHNIRKENTKESIGFASYQLSCRISKHLQGETRKYRLMLKEWSSFLRVSDTNIYLPEGFNHQSSSSFSVAENGHKNEQLLQDMARRYRKIIKHLKIIDIKFEHLVVRYGERASFKISSAQIYLESVQNSSYGGTINLLQSHKHVWGDHELSISANAVCLEIDKMSTLRIPLINILLTSDYSLYLMEVLKLNEVKVCSNTNIINPSFYVTLDQILYLVSLTQESRAKPSKKPVNTSLKVLHGEKNWLSNMLTSIPGFIFESNLSNFNVTIQLSKDQSLSCKIYDIQCFFHHRNKATTVDDVHMALADENLSFCMKDTFRKRLANYLKIIDISLVYLDVAGDIPELVPIYDFERWDLFINKLETSELNIQSTLRYSNFTLSSLKVLERLVEVGKLLKSCYYPSATSSKDTISSNDVFFGIDWSVRLRLKNFSCSVLIAHFLPRLFDPLEVEGLNLADVTRGGMLIFNESWITVDKKLKKLEIVEASIVRVMDSSQMPGKSLPDDCLKLKGFSVVFAEGKNPMIRLPAIHLKVDVNIIWLFFYFKAIFDFYKPEIAPSNGEKEHLAVNSGIKADVDVTKIILEVLLPQDTPVLLYLRGLNFNSNTGILCIEKLAALVQSVYVKQVPIYVALMTIEDVAISLPGILKEKEIKINTRSIRFHTEYHFKFYMIVTNIITAFKSYKQIRYGFSDLTKYRRYFPRVEAAKRVPKIVLKADIFETEVEEDPFEQDLGLILKIGVIEQRERLQKLEEFNEQKRELVRKQVEEILPRSSELFEAETKRMEGSYERLLENFSTSWITRYRKAKLSFHGMPSHVKVHNEFGHNYYVFSGKTTSTVGKLVIKDMVLKVHPPSFPLDSYADFLYKYGKGIPKDMEYTLLIPIGIQVDTSLWELRLRDYPVPVISLPDTSTKGDLIFAEKMPGEHSIRTDFVPFVPLSDVDTYCEKNTIYGSNVIGTVNAVKTYFNIESNVSSSLPTNITWGKSLQPGYQSLMMWFDYLTKPKLDPSAKLGFWDKFRYLFHGSWKYTFSEKSELHLNIKGAHDPYKITDDGAGLSFCWSGGTILHLHGSSDPEEFLKIESQKFRLTVPDFTEPTSNENVIMNLDGQVTWKMGLSFEQGDLTAAGDEPRIEPDRKHYDIQLVHPDFVADKDSYDSYEGFRSNFIHMTFGVYSFRDGSKNSLYLAPYSSAHFLKWWRLFDTYTSGPIRQGPLFPDVMQNNNKFGRSLFTIKYQLHLEPLTVTHVYRLTTHSQNDPKSGSNVGFTGLKGRVRSLKMDLHQKRIKLTHTNEKLKKSKPVWKFRMSHGEIDCIEADVRLLSAIFTQSSTEEDLLPLSAPSLTKRSYHSAAQDEWYDYQDYVDLNQVSLETASLTKIEAIPLLSSPRISYFRLMNDEGYAVKYPFGSEDTHTCFIGQNHPELTQRHLAEIRQTEISDKIKKISAKINLLNQSSELKNERRISQLQNQLNELNSRLVIIKEVLKDIELSIETPVLNNPERSNHLDVYDSNYIDSELDDVVTNEMSTLFRSNTVDSFRSMRRATTSDVKSTYDNRFMVHNIKLKVNKTTRRNLLEYASSAFERKSTEFFLTYKSVTILRDLLNIALTNVNSSAPEEEVIDDNDTVTNEDFLESFEKLIREVPNSSFESFDDYLIQLISPQLQLTSETEPNAAVLFVAREIEMGIINILQVIGSHGRRIETDVNTFVESRYCVVSKDIQLVTLFKEDVSSATAGQFSESRYGATEKKMNWPPWIPLEVCFDGTMLQQYVILNRRSMFLTYTSPNPLYFTNNQDSSTISRNSKFRIGVPGLVITSTSQQYTSVYNIVRDLLSFDSLDKKAEKLSKVLLAEEVKNNLEKLDISIVTNLQKRVKELYYTRTFLKLNDPRLFAETSKRLTLEIQATLSELLLLMSAIKRTYDTIGKKDNSSRKKFIWQVGTTELIWELYDNKKKPFITIGLGPSTYIRSQTMDGSNSNTVTVQYLRCFNQQEKPAYYELIAPFEENIFYNCSQPMLDISWVLGPSIGGISVIENIIVSLQPIFFRMDHLTADRFMEYLFPKVENGNESRSGSPVNPPVIAANRLTDGTVSTSEDSDVLQPRSSPIGIFAAKTLRRSKSSGSFLSIRSGGNLTNTNNNSNRGSSEFELPVPDLDVVSLIDREIRNSPTFFLKQTEDSINEMVKRSGTYMNIRSVLIQRTTMSISYKGAHSLFTDVDDLIVKVPNLHYYDKLWSRDEFLAAVKKDIIKVVLQHMGNIIGNKFIPHKRESKKKATRDIINLMHIDSQSVYSDISSISVVKSPVRFNREWRKSPLADSTNEESNTSTDDDKKSTTDDMDNSMGSSIDNGDTKPFYPERTNCI